VSGVRGLTLVLLGADAGRAGGAAALAAASAALGAETIVYLHDAAVPLAAGTLFDEALALGARMVLCQTGLAAAGLDLSAMDARLEAGGLVGLLAGLGDARLVVI